MKTRTLLLLAVAILSPAAALAVPSTVGFSARLADDGQPVEGDHVFVFKLYDGADPAVSSVPLWQETKQLAVRAGVVTTSLGDVTAIDAGTVFDGNDRFLEVTVDGEVLSPRMAVQSVPYALHAGFADGAAVAVAAVGAAAAPWTGLTGKPAGFADDVDDVGSLACQTYTSSTAVAAGAVAGVTAGCDQGTMVGGGYAAEGNQVVVMSRPGPSGWDVAAKNNDLVPQNLYAQVRCCWIQ